MPLRHTADYVPDSTDEMDSSCRICVCFNECRRSSRSRESMGMIAVALLCPDPLTREGALARLSSHRELDVQSWEFGCRADVLLVVTGAITVPVLALMESARSQSQGVAPKLVVVADQFSEEQVARMIVMGLTALLHRRESSFNRIVEAICAAAGGRVDLPESVQMYLLGRVRSGGGLSASPNGIGTELETREVDVLQLLSDGLGTREMASQLSYSERTVKNIIHAVVFRLDLRNRTHAVAYALRTGII
ncbi:response regulator transcription factor [Nocardia sp. NPDC088792]|uniref:response regulator transcription factor n=1 Tax=Nocardia sp. NPDC088792 TaxID=3364332 RepID=UPI0038207CDC